MINFYTDGQLRFDSTLNENLKLSTPFSSAETPAIGAQPRHE